MCELLGIHYSRPVLADFSLRYFALRDAQNAQGWGLAWYSGASLAVAKEPITWRESAYSSFLIEYPHLRSHLFVGHVRKATVGGAPKRADTHPFSRELRGREYCFAHNGTVRDAATRLSLGRFVPIGDTDSEHIFCFLLGRIEATGRDLGDAAQWPWLHHELATVNATGTFNCLLADGRSLFAYHDRNGFKGLCTSTSWLRARRPEALNDPAVHVDLECDDGGGGACTERGIVVATQPLDGAHAWRRVEPGELLVIRGGRIVFSSTGAELAAS